MLRFYFLGIGLIAFTSNAQELISFSENGMYGYSQNETVVILPTYAYAFDFTNNLGLVKNGEKWGYIDAQNQVIVPFELDKGTLFENNVAEVLVNGKMALIDTLGNFIIEPESDLFYADYGGRGYTIVNNGMKGYLPTSGNYRVPCSYVEVKGNPETASALREDGLWDIYANGKLHLEGVDRSMSYSKRVDGSFLEVNSINGKFGVSSMNQDWLIKPTYDNAWIETNYRDRTMIILENNREDGSHEFYLATVNGELINQTPYSNIDYLQGGEGYVYSKNKVGYVKNFGDYAIKPGYDSLVALSNGYIAKRKGKFGIIDSAENVVIPFKIDGFTIEKEYVELYDDEYMEFMGYETVMEMVHLISGDKSAFYFPLTGNYMKPKKLGEVILKKELNGAMIKKNDKYGLVTEGLIIPTVYEEVFITNSASSYVADEYLVQYEEETVYWGLNEDEYVIPHYRDEREKLKKYPLEQLSGSGGLHFIGDEAALYSTRSGKLVTGYIFEGSRIGRFDEPYAILYQNGKVGVYTYDGQELLPPIYDTIEYNNFQSVYVELGEEGYLIHLATGEKMKEWED
jgi:hypothetical protein